VDREEPEPRLEEELRVKTQIMTVACLERTTTTASGFEDAVAPKPKPGSLEEGKLISPASAVEMALEPEEMTDAEMKKRAWGTGSADSEMHQESERLASWERHVANKKAGSLLKKDILEVVGITPTEED
jgi:hypothetical protein